MSLIIGLLGVICLFAVMSDFLITTVGTNDSSPIAIRIAKVVKPDGLSARMWCRLRVLNWTVKKRPNWCRAINPGGWLPSGNPF